MPLAPGGVLHSHWAGRSFPRPAFDNFVIGPGSVIASEPVRIDTGSDYTALAATVGNRLGIRLPFPRQQSYSGAGGVQASTLSFAPVGLASLFVTDYREYCYLPRPLIGFHNPGPGASRQRSVLGLTGFLEHFRFALEPAPPLVELDPIPGFAGLTGPLPVNRPLLDFIAELRGPT